MKRTSNRLERVAEQIQRKLAQIIQQEIRDPRLPGLITISGVEVSKDLSHAKVYFTALSATTIQVETTQAETILNTAASYLRTALARTLEARIIPQLHFMYDHSLEHGRHLSQLMKDVQIKDADDAE
ncbi:MAG: 30S ribosome-binding factor RbfA [Gammaproteobacteria bacterium]|nr:30S ribosome-binding factor RbfA [Gammaproteobacteria bacterium]